ncbi:MAG TPA: tRNA (N(6)-L-threonylcarbamoyladenosine(37)-C(2))-methylthiotransferase MtaB [Candidatus Fimadaptatus faecigallinarum]|uniref:tRNA-2-methylthio-N(6)-dimethylallyladenosine synthase n=1 Tax=Candidatus Fimadaptatus faecigallinarum TaxID=2840814 RepID=A0A9D1S400_9FIRM|nr:tRNA (N(6)-L-threonylcarbamoyladenosine(37)-C(2))-methylthiotransferase MtaB [Candidatus Fimadaptatus faecigallinarum]
MRRIAFHTLGCKVNQYDTQAMLESFQAAGWQVCEFGEDADAYLINTCTVTGTGDRKSLRLIRHVHGEHPQAAIIVTGCLAQRVPEQVALPGVKLVLGTAKRAQVVELLERALQGDGCLIEVNPLKGAAFEPLTVNSHEGHTRATMKIQEGCDRYCSYCIIPYVRGPVRSLELGAVEREAARLGAAGYAEIVVTGIHLTSYGRGMDCELCDALDAVSCAPGVRRIRLGSLEPYYVTEERAQRLAGMPKLCRQFHLSMQSGSAGVLERMHRRYTPEEYAHSVELLRQYMPGCAITTDVIAGFPGETEEEARETLRFIERIGFSRIHVFPYSQRAGTVAARLPGQVPVDVKRRRTAELIELGGRLSAAYQRAALGSVREVLLEEEVAPGLCEGYTREYLRVRAQGVPGEIVNLRLTDISEDSMLGVRE